MTIENAEEYVGSLVNWAVLDGCFGRTTIAVSDIDGAVERGGAHLFLERKKGLRTKVKPGQDRLFASLSRHGHSVMVFWTADARSDAVTRVRLYDHGSHREFPSDFEGLRLMVAAWFLAAELRQHADQRRLQNGRWR